MLTTKSLWNKHELVFGKEWQYEIRKIGFRLTNHSLILKIINSGFLLISNEGDKLPPVIPDELILDLSLGFVDDNSQIMMNDYKIIDPKELSTTMKSDSVYPWIIFPSMQEKNIQKCLSRKSNNQEIVDLGSILIDFENDDTILFEFKESNLPKIKAVLNNAEKKFEIEFAKLDR